MAFAFTSAVGKVLGAPKISDNGRWADLRIGTREFDQPSMASTSADLIRQAGITDGALVEFSGRVVTKTSKAGNGYQTVWLEDVRVIDPKTYQAAVEAREARRQAHAA